MALAAAKSKKAPAKLAKQLGRHPNQNTERKRLLQEGAAGVFGESGADLPTPVDLKALRAKIGKLTRENDLLAEAHCRRDAVEQQDSSSAALDENKKRPREELGISAGPAWVPF